MPEALAWYALLGPGVVGLLALLREGRPGARTLVLIMGLIAALYAVVEGNVGTFYRHRAQFQLLMLIPIGIGLGEVRPMLSRFRQRLALGAPARVLKSRSRPGRSQAR